MIEKAATMFYLMVKNYPFQNGNKRIAMTTMLVLPYKNNKWLKADNRIFYEFALLVAESKPVLNKEIITKTKKFIKKYMVDI
ncbi:MAG: Fic family protein [Patescibacteria group bacterium]